MSTGLAKRLREGTWPLHAAAERAGVMPAMLRGALPALGFWQMQRNLLLVYQALEDGLAQQASHPLLAPLQLGPLARCAALQADLADGAGPDWHTALPPGGAAATAYANRLQALARHQPSALAAHAYVRYLGDLAGGQALRRVAQKAYGLHGEAGTRFFDFGPPAEVARLGQGLRTALDSLPLDDTAQQALVAEAQWAFAQHALLFEELAGP
ncbi:MAG: biliverdin-producing heme oxygenase [Aquabacterium sp.]|nr:biliverdin-producing heme oxygenase [Aquabacterium sp.]